MSRPIHTWVAMCFLAIRVSALPQAATAPTAPLPPGPIVNVTQQTPITGNVSIMTSLIIGDKSGCDPDQKIAINQAYLDALNLVGTVGGYNGPGYLYASTSVPPWDYFGAFLRHTDAEKSQIMSKSSDALIDCSALTDKGNFISAQAPNKQWGIGDWWYNRHFDIFCNDPGDKEGHSCSAQGSASGYEVEPSYRNDGGVYPLINFCDSFWNMETLAQRVAQVEAGGFGFDKNDVRSLVCQGEIKPTLRDFYETYEPRNRCLLKRRVRIFARDVPHECTYISELFLLTSSFE